MMWGHTYARKLTHGHFSWVLYIVGSIYAEFNRHLKWLTKKLTTVNPWNKNFMYTERYGNRA